MKKQKYVKIGLAVGTLVACVAAVLIYERLTKNSGQLSSYPRMQPGEQILNPLEGSYPRSRPARSFTLEGPFPDLPREVLIYRRKEFPTMKKEQVELLANRHFGIDLQSSPGVPYPDTNVFVFKTPTHTLMLHSLDWFDLRGNNLYRATTKDRRDYPADEECKKIAAEFLATRGLEEAEVCESRLTDNSGVGMICVTWDRKINQMSSWGYQSTISVAVGPDGEIVRAEKNWPPIEPWKLARIITPQQAFKRLNQGYAATSLSGGPIASISLCYDTGSGGGYYLPVYYFASAPSNPAFPSYAILPAVDPNYLSTPPWHRPSETQQPEYSQTPPGYYLNYPYDPNRPNDRPR